MDGVGWGGVGCVGVWGGVGGGGGREGGVVGWGGGKGESYLSRCPSFSREVAVGRNLDRGVGQSPSMVTDVMFVDGFGE